jgi:hypothetical protein
MNDRTMVMVMVTGIGAHLTNDEKRAHLADLRRERLIDQVCVQEIFSPNAGVVAGQKQFYHDALCLICHIETFSNQSNSSHLVPEPLRFQSRVLP